MLERPQFHIETVESGLNYGRYKADPMEPGYGTTLGNALRRILLRSLEGAVLRGEYPPMTFHAVKDLSAAVDSARSVQQAMPVTSLSLALYQLANDKLGGLQTSTEVIRYFLDN